MKKKFLVVLLLVIGIFAFAGCKKTEETSKGKLVENKDYFIRTYGGQYLDITKRGYYIDTLDEPNAPYYYIICMGEKSTGGYSLTVKEITRVDGKTEVIVNENTPGPNDIVTQAFTYPTLMIEFPKAQENIVIKNANGEEFQQLSDY